MKQRRNVGISSHKCRNENSDLSQRVEERSPSNDHIFLSPNRVFTVCLAMRMANSLLVQTYFNPDEHWQAPEVAHRIIFGYGHLTWEWKKGIRSYLHPMLFALLYKVLSLLGLDTPWFMMRAPRLLQSIVSAIGDFYLFKLSTAVFGVHVAHWALFSQLTNWFMFFCFTRTSSNNLETVLTTVSLYYWPCVLVSSNKRKWALVLAALSCAIRPTSAITWLYVGLIELFIAQDRLKFVFLEIAPIGILVLGLTCVLDRVMYGSWILVPLNFLKFNFLSSGGDYYGTHPWHWYFTQGFPVMLFTFLPFSVMGIILSRQWKLFGLIAWVLGLYSLLGHKEFRFVLPVLPIALMFSGYTLASLSNSPDSLDGKRSRFPKSCSKFFLKRRFAAFLLVTNLPMALYMSLVHQRGSEDVMTYLSQEALKGKRGSEDVMKYLSQEALDGKVKSVLFLMPCHSTPYYSVLHQNLPMRFLDCTPSEDRETPDESDRYMMDPIGFATEMAKNWTSSPSHIVLFDSEERLLREFLNSHSYIEIRRFFHAHFEVDRHLQASVVVYNLTSRDGSF